MSTCARTGSTLVLLYVSKARISVRPDRSVRGILSSGVEGLMPRHSPYRIELNDEERAALGRSRARIRCRIGR